MLFRKILISQLCAAQDCPLIFISGPAGSGKTSLACQAVRVKRFQVAWYSLDEEDNEPDQFFRYLFTVLAQVDQQLNKAFGPILEQQREFGNVEIIARFFEPLSNISQDIYLVLDDFHHVSNEKIHALLMRLIQQASHRLHLVILSRYQLPEAIDAIFPPSKRMELLASDLRFTEEETAALFKTNLPFSFTPSQIEKLNRHVEGWAAGLQLIGLSVSAKGDAVDLSYILRQAHEQIGSYLIHDILRVQPEKIRTFVFATALLDRFNPELCTEVTGIADAREVLGHLTRINLFLIPLDTRKKWYRYHHIFSEVIRHQTALLNPAAIPETLCRAAKWLARNNHLEDAMRCAFRTGDFEFAADLMEDYILEYIETFDIAAGLRWISKLPQNIFNQKSLLKLQKCCFQNVLMEFSEVKETLLSIERDGKPDFSRYSDVKRKLCHDFLAYLKCILHILYAGEPADIVRIQPLREKIFPQNPLLVGGIETQIVFTLISRGDLASAESYFARLLRVQLYKPSQRIRKKIYHAKMKALIAQHRGKLRQAETIILQVLQFLDRQGFDNSPIVFLLHRNLGSIYFNQNRLEKARQCADKAVKYCESELFGLIDEIMAGNELWLQLHRAAGEYEQAVQCIRKMQNLSVRLGIPQIAASADACFARIAIDRDNLAVAQLWSKRRKLSPDEPFTLLFAMECLIQIRLFYAKGQYRNAAQLLKRLRERCAKRMLMELVLKVDILQAATLFAMNQEAKAISLMKKTLIFAGTEGYIRPFVNDSKLIAPVLRRLSVVAPFGLSPSFIQRLFVACDIDRSEAKDCQPQKNCGREELTQREIEILEWMAQGFQNKEIARKGCIAVTTVKSHVSNILVKLSVKTRTQAVLKAKEINLLKAG